MPVSDKQVAALRAQLSGNRNEHLRLIAQLREERARAGYATLLASAFFEAVERRFVRDGKVADEAEVIDFVGDLRARATAADDLDPLTAERLIMHALGKGTIEDIDSRVRVHTQILVLAGLVGDAAFTPSELDEFLEKARSDAERLTG